MENLPGFMVSPLGVPTPPPDVPGPWSAIAAFSAKAVPPATPNHLPICILLVFVGSYVQCDDCSCRAVPGQCSPKGGRLWDAYADGDEFAYGVDAGVKECACVNLRKTLFSAHWH